VHTNRAIKRHIIRTHHNHKASKCQEHLLAALEHCAAGARVKGVLIQSLITGNLCVCARVYVCSSVYVRVCAFVCGV